MRKLIHSLALFAAGLVAGHFFLQPSQAQDSRLTGLRLNHYGVAAKDFNATVDFYTKTLGFKEAFSFRDKDGNVTTSYVQMSKENFIEISHASTANPAGLNHVGIWVDDLNATVAGLRQRGVTVADPHTGGSKAPLTNITDPNGVRLELLEYPAESMQKKAMEAYR